MRITGRDYVAHAGVRDLYGTRVSHYVYAQAVAAGVVQGPGTPVAGHGSGSGASDPIRDGGSGGAGDLDDARTSSSGQRG